MKKKILSMVMAAALALSVSSVSQAALEEKELEYKDGKYAAPEIVANGAYAAPTIKVKLDLAAKDVIINPYGLSKNVSDVPTDEQKEQLINKIESIENKSEVALAVNATVSATTEGSTKIATAPVVPTTEKANSIFAYLNMKEGNAALTSMKLAENGYDAKSKNQVAFTSKPTTKKELVILDDPAKTNGNKIVSYKILGTVAANPTTPWAATDKIKFSIVFDFEPRLVSSGS